MVSTVNMWEESKCISKTERRKCNVYIHIGIVFSTLKKGISDTHATRLNLEGIKMSKISRPTTGQFCMVQFVWVI